MITYDKANPVGYEGISGVDLVEELLYYGISSISLITTGSTREGIRACVSLTPKEKFPLLEERLRQFNEDHKDKNFNVVDLVKGEFE